MDGRRAADNRRGGSPAGKSVFVVILLGYRGTGKSTVGQALARRLGWDFVDLDEEIERLAGASIAEQFARDGEAVFRDREADALRAHTAGGRVVLATGGGVILREANRRRLRQLVRRGGRTVWLRAAPETIASRLAADATTPSRRPNLTPLGGVREIVELLAQRTPWYRECANLTIDTDAKTHDEIVREILAALPSHYRRTMSA